MSAPHRPSSSQGPEWKHAARQAPRPPIRPRRRHVRRPFQRSRGAAIPSGRHRQPRHRRGPGSPTCGPRTGRTTSERSTTRPSTHRNRWRCRTDGSTSSTKPMVGGSRSCRHNGQGVWGWPMLDGSQIGECARCTAPTTSDRRPPSSQRNSRSFASPAPHRLPQDGHANPNTGRDATAGSS